MSLFFPVETFFENSGNAAALFGENLRDEVLKFSCTLWQNFPNFFTQNALPQTAFARGFMNQVCSIDNPNPDPPTQQFTDGQCVGVSYNVVTEFKYVGGISRFLSSTVIGPIDSIQAWIGDTGSAPPTFTRIQAFNIDGDPTVYENSGTGFSTDLEETINTVTANGGEPSCGDPPVDYNSPQPRSEDLTTIIVVPNLDGLQHEFNLTYNKVSNNFNFPMGFNLGGISVVLDMSGMRFYGSPKVTQPTTPSDKDDNDPPSPGNPTPNDGVGGGDSTIYKSDYPALPTPTVPETALEVLEYLVCEAGVIEILTKELKIITGNIPIWNFVIELIGAVLEELCQEDGETGEGATVGFPEYWGVRPGAERPAIVYLWKEYIDGKWQRSTFSSTVSHPTQEAIDNMENLTAFPKNIGTIVWSLVLTDGSRVRASGTTAQDASDNFQFLVDQVDPLFLPFDWQSRVVSSLNNGLEERTLYLRQSEYYPKGGGAGKSPDKIYVYDL